MNPMLQHSLAEHEYLRARLKAEFPDADEETLRDTLEGLSSLPEMLACALRSYLDDLALTAALGIRINDMQERLDRIVNPAASKSPSTPPRWRASGDRALGRANRRAGRRPSCRRRPG